MEHPRAPLELAVATILSEVRSTPNETSGSTPFKRLFGREMRTRLCLLVPASEHQGPSVKPREVDYTKRRTIQRNYEIGELVWQGVGQDSPFVRRA